MMWIINNWYMLVGALVLFCFIGALAYGFISMDREEQLEKVTEWLKKAVTEAERELGSGTGQLKLRTVYSAFVGAFPWLVKLVTFTQFEALVKEALKWMDYQMQTNDKFKEYVLNESK